MENIITINEENIASEHICCAIADKKSAVGVEKKKQWILNNLSKGYKFTKVDVRGKAFIEYIPAENAWAPIDAEGYMFIGCFWVAGSHASKGYGSALLDKCKQDAKNMKGIVALTTNKKKPFLSDKKYYLKQGFEVCDSLDPYYELLVLKNDKSAESPKFNDYCRIPAVDADGLHIYHTLQCPFNAFYLEDLKEICKNAEVKLTIHTIDSINEAKKCPNPFPLYSVYYNGKFVTNHILNDTGFKKFIHPLLLQK